LPRRTRLLSLLLSLAALAAAIVLSACGGDDEDAQAVIDRALSEPIGSADVTVGLDFAAEGSAELSEPARAQLTGPYVSGTDDTLPSFDWDLSFTGGGAGLQVPPIGLISTGDNFFVEFQGQAYEVGEELVAQAIAQQQEQQGEGEGLAAFGIDPRDWVVDPQDEGAEDVAGVETTHVSSAIDLPGLLTDLNEVAQSAGGTAPGAPAAALTEEQIAQVEEVVEDPRFDVFVGTDDGILRRLTTAAGFTVPEEAQAQAGGTTGGSVTFSVEFADVGGEQEIVAPADPRPIDDLAQQLGGLLGGGALPGAGSGSVPGLPSPGAGGGQAPGTAPPAGGQGPGAGGGQAPGAGGQTPGAGGQAPPGSPDPEAFQEYGECLQQADPQDQQALKQCNELLLPSG